MNQQKECANHYWCPWERHSETWEQAIDYTFGLPIPNARSGYWVAEATSWIPTTDEWYGAHWCLGAWCECGRCSTNIIRQQPYWVPIAICKTQWKGSMTRCWNLEQLNNLQVPGLLLSYWLKRKMGMCVSMLMFASGSIIFNALSRSPGECGTSK